jgi:hypothetical protein
MELALTSVKLVTTPEHSPHQGKLPQERKY